VGGRFITFEGGEGAGKTTQIKRLAARLRTAGITVTETREPGGSERAEAIRNLLLSGRVETLGAEAEAILFAAARADHVDQLIVPNLGRGDWVLCDRFADSTRAYQGAAGLSGTTIDLLEGAAVGATKPDLTLMLDLPVETGMARVNGRAAPDRFERDPDSEHAKRRAIFLAIAEKETERCRIVDATGDEEAVAAAIWAAVFDRFGAVELGQDG
jgi:dTMP kinase